MFLQTLPSFCKKINLHSAVAPSLTILLSAISLFGCGGGGNDIAGIDGSGSPVTSTTGTVNGFGSVIVNGVRYHSDNAKILVDGELADEDSLRTGYQVRVTGTLNSDGTGNANSIEFSPTLVGAITQIDTQNEQLVLLQQTVQITSATLFDAAIDPNNLSGLTPGTYILVSGQRNSEGLIAATRVELAAQTTAQLEGSVATIDAVNRTFGLNNLTVNYAAATIKNNGNNPLQNGFIVNVTGSLDSAGIFQASSVSVQPKSFSSEVKTADIEGFVTRFVSSADFDVAGVACSSDSATIYVKGSNATLALGSSVKVSGKVNSAGVLVAQNIEFRQQVINEITGEVSSVSTPVGGAIATGSFIIAGTSIQTNNSTAYEDGSNDKLRRFNFADIRPGNFLKVSGYTSENMFIATKIERRIFSIIRELRYQGVVTQIAANSFTVYGQTITIDSASEIRGAMGASLTQQEFLAQALNQHVRVRGNISNGVFIATHIEIRPKFRDDFHHAEDDQNDRDGDPREGGPGPQDSGPQASEYQQQDSRDQSSYAEGGHGQDGPQGTQR